jgi:hypothetical protein
MMVEGQEGFEPQSLAPIHRIDRVTSGLTLFSTSTDVSRILQKSLLERGVRKLYLAKVSGKFPLGLEELTNANRDQLEGTAICKWCDDGRFLQVDAAVETIDPANGVRAVTKFGKPSTSRFRLIRYEPTDGSSIIACSPITGRNHQLRVHLQWLGYPIVGDVQYGGKEDPAEPSLFLETIVKRMRSASAEMNTHVALPELSLDDVEAAKQACGCCTGGGIQDSFTPSQLLQGGHSICLHALHYQVLILRKKKSKETEVKEMARLDLKVDPPQWAADIREDDLITCIELLDPNRVTFPS